jgi:hypothetical protein
MNLVIAWFASALAGAVVFLAGEIAVGAFMGAPIAIPITARSLKFMALVFAFGLVVQLLYGGLVYLALRRGGLNLAAVFLAYFVPVFLFCAAGSDTGKSAMMSIPVLLWASALAVVAWSVITRKQQQG